MNDEEAPAAAVDTAIPQASNKNGSALNAVRDRKLSVVSKQYDMDGDGELNEAEQAMRNLDKSNRGFLRNEEVYKMMVDQLQMQKDLFKTKKVVAGLMVFVVILALSTLGTSFASAILAKDSTTNDQNELVSKETGEALATQSTAKVIVIEKDEELARRRTLECVKQQGQATGVCNFNTLGIIDDGDGKIMSRLCQDSQTVEISWQENGGTVTRRICPVTGNDVRFHPDVPTFNYKGNPFKSNMKITTPTDVIDLVDQADGTYELMIAQIGGQTDVVLVCNEGDEPVCGSDGTRYDCAAVADGATLAALPMACTCGGGVSGKNPADECMEMSCPDQPVCLPESCWNGVENGSCECCPTPTSQDDCLLGYTFNDGSSVCDAPVSTVACAPPKPVTCDPLLELNCIGQVKFCTDGAGGSYTVNPDGCNNCAFPTCCDGSAPVDSEDPFLGE